MPNVSMVCPKCDTTMEVGFVLDKGYSAAGEWIEGEMEKGFWGGIKDFLDRKRYQMTAYRCPGCGYVELYAPFPNITEP
jgi:predicted nucleic-acid-binding Zn-ribbon protein